MKGGFPLRSKLGLICTLTLLGSAFTAQEFRSMISGHVLDCCIYFTVPGTGACIRFRTFRRWHPKFRAQSRNQEPKQRLRDTIKNLNRHQKHHLIQFSGVGSGEAVRWDPISPEVRSDPQPSWR